MVENYFKQNEIKEEGEDKKMKEYLKILDNDLFNEVDKIDQKELFDDFKKEDKSRDIILDNSLVDQNKEDWIREQLNRKKKAKQACSNLNIKTDLDWLVSKRQKLKNLLVDDERGVIYCYVPKVNN